MNAAPTAPTAPTDPAAQSAAQNATAHPERGSPQPAGERPEGSQRTPRPLLAGGLRLVACALAGAAMALAAGWPGRGVVADLPAIDQPVLDNWAWLLQWGATVLFFAALAGGPSPTWRQVALRSLVMAFSWQLGTIWWIYIGMTKYAETPPALAAAGLAGLGLYLAAYSLLACLAFAWCCLRRPTGAPSRQSAATPVATALGFAACWLLADLGRALVMGGYPWAAAGYAHVQGPLRGLAPWVGVYGVGAVSALLAAAAVLLLQKRSGPAWTRLGVGGALALALGAAARQPDQDFTQPAGELETVLLQGNVDQRDKFDPGKLDTAIGWYLHALKGSYADLALAPETAVPVLEHELPASHWAGVRQRLQARSGAVLIGVPQRGPQGGDLNALLGMGHADTLVEATPEGVYRYHKHHLVPFAEFTPPGFAWFTRAMDLPMGAFSSGGGVPRPMRLRTRGGAELAVAPLICYEDLFTDELAQRFAEPALAPHVLANASNMAWFDDSPAMAQHLRIARYRSLEFQRPTLRATNTGPTVVIDHQGTVTRALEPHTRAVLGALVQGRSGLTPYAWWVSRWGLWPMLALGLAVLMWAAWRRRLAPAAAATTGSPTPAASATPR